VMPDQANEAKWAKQEPQKSRREVSIRAHHDAQRDGGISPSKSINVVEVQVEAGDKVFDRTRVPWRTMS
jgi:hypothetical protein